MNAKTAKETTENYRGVTTSEEEQVIKKYWQAKGFLEALSQFQPVVEALEKIHLEIIRDKECTCAGNSDYVCDYHLPETAIEKFVREGLQSYKLNVLGEKE